jgi:putative endonuclease
MSETHHYVYIIYSPSSGHYYKGYTTNLEKRLARHNNGESAYTRNFVPWNLVYVEKYKTKTEALIREKKLKKYSKLQLEQLIKSPKNEI